MPDVACLRCDNNLTCFPGCSGANTSWYVYKCPGCYERIIRYLGLTIVVQPDCPHVACNLSAGSIYAGWEDFCSKVVVTPEERGHLAYALLEYSIRSAAAGYFCSSCAGHYVDMFLIKLGVERPV